MQRLLIVRTDKTPDVHFDPAAGLFEISGSSIHENAEAFFRPLLEMVEAYTREPAPRTTVKLTLDYFNSSSSKYILDLLRLIDEVHVSGMATATMEWHYDEDDLDMEEAGEDYKELLEMPVTVVCNRSTQ